MQPLPEGTRNRSTSILSSVVFHATALAAIFWFSTAVGTHVIKPVQQQRAAALETRGGTHEIKIVLSQSDLAAHTRTPVPHADSAAKTNLPIPPRTVQKKSGGGAPAVHHTGDGEGTQFGNGTDAEDVRPAFPVFSPRPPVTDRALLPSAEKKIVVDVNVDSLGAVVSEVLVKGIGNQLDQIVLDTVKTWRFQPATVNGKPVPTQAELIFPFNPSYPITAS
jgi:TonB family protein